MRHVSAAGENLVKTFEGLEDGDLEPPVLQPYLCPAGEPTIGYGHLIRPGEADDFKHGIDQAIAEDLLRMDLEAAERAVLRLIDVPLEDGQFDALVDFTFNLGAGALQASTLRRVINRGDHGAAPAQFRRWVYAKGRRLAGLVRRRDAEATIYEVNP